jgi:glycosyltransferase involved in cell wall biosynthesis
MKKTLILCSHYPLPESIGMNIRTMNFVRFFKNYGAVDVAYSHILLEGKLQNRIFSNEYFLEQEVIESFRDRLMRWINIKDRPFPISNYADVSERRLLSIIESNDYDYIFVRYINNTISLFKLPDEHKIRIIIDFDDILSGSLYESKMDSVNGLFRKFRLRLNQKYLMDYEKKCLDFGASLFCSRNDMAKVVGKTNGTNTFVIPNIYHNESFEEYDFGEGFENRNTLLFVGTLSYVPNIIGLKWFVESVFPYFKKEFSDGKLLVVGRFPNSDIKRLCESTDGLELYVNVSDIRGYYKKCNVAIVPLLSGGGTRIKILEAALANRAVLSTPIGAEGLDFKEGTDLLLFKDANSFLTQYCRLLKRDLYNSIVRNAKKVVVTKYSVENFDNAMGQVLNGLGQGKD